MSKSETVESRVRERLNVVEGILAISALAKQPNESYRHKLVEKLWLRYFLTEESFYEELPNLTQGMTTKDTM